MSQWIWVLILSIVVLCLRWMWSARKKRRGLHGRTVGFRRPNEFATTRPTRPEEQTEPSLEAVVQHGEAESRAAISDGPKDVTGDLPPSASSSETSVGLETKNVQTGPRTNMLLGTSESEEPTLAPPAHISHVANGCHLPQRVSSIEDNQNFGAMKGECATAPHDVDEPVPAADKFEIRYHRGPVLQGNATESGYRREDRPAGVAATKTEKAAKIGPQGWMNKTAIEAAGNVVNREANAPSPTKSTAPLSVDKASQLTRPEPEELEASPEPPPQDPPKYLGLRATPSIPQANKRKSRTSRAPTNLDSELRMRLHLVFDRRGSSLRLSFIPEWHQGLPDDCEVTGTQGDFAFCRLDQFYQDVAMPDIGTALREGVSWRGRGTLHRYRWVLGGRELYVLAPGDDAGLCGFVSVPRLGLGGGQVVLATTERRADALAALSEAGCDEPMIMGETAEGVPPGWLLFRGVEPTRPVEGRDEADILNALRPVAEIAPHFSGGIRLGGRTWLLGYPPRIRFTGAGSSEFKVSINGEPATASPDGGYVAAGWDTEGRHSLWFAGRLRKYLLIQGREQWTAWSAHDFGTGATICGPLMLPRNEACCHQVRVPAQNPVLVGAVPGQIFRCNVRTGLRNDELLSLAPFPPVWALPLNSLLTDKRTARVVLVGSLHSVQRMHVQVAGQRFDPAIAGWCAVIRDAGRKGLQLATEESGAAVLWREYRRAAKQLWREPAFPI